MAFKSMAYMAAAALLLAGCAGHKPVPEPVVPLLPQVQWNSLQMATAETLCRGNSQLRTKIPSKKRECLQVLEEAFAVCSQRKFSRNEIYCSAQFASSRLRKTVAFTWDVNDMMAEAYVRAGDLEAKQSLETALRFYEAALADKPLFSRALEGVVKMKSLTEGPAASKAFLERLLKENPGSASVMANLGIWYLDAGDFKNGSEWNKKTVAADSRYSDLFRMLGIRAKAEGDATNLPALKRHSYRYALASFEIYRKVELLDPTGWKLEADLYFDIRDLDRAVIAYQTVLKIDPDFPEARLRLAQIHRHRGELKRAEELLKEEMERNPGLSQPYVERANMHMAQKEFAEAEKMFAKALEWQFGNTDALFGLAVIRHIEGRYDEALAIFERMEKLGHDGADLHWQKGLIYQKLNRSADALRSFVRYGSLARDEQAKEAMDRKIRELSSVQEVSVEENLSVGEAY